MLNILYFICNLSFGFWFDKLFLYRSKKEGGKRTIFVLNDSYEIVHAAKFLHSFINYELGCFADNSKLDTSSKEAWTEHLNNFHVSIMIVNCFHC